VIRIVAHRRAPRIREVDHAFADPDRPDGGWYHLDERRRGPRHGRAPSARRLHALLERGVVFRYDDVSQ